MDDVSQWCRRLRRGMMVGLIFVALNVSTQRSSYCEAASFVGRQHIKRSLHERSSSNSANTLGPLSNFLPNRSLTMISLKTTLPSLTALPKSALPLTYMFLLALQFAVQPIITKKFAPKTIIRSTYVLAQEISRLLIAATLLTATNSWNVACQHWTWQTALATAGFPSVLYLVQSYCSLIAYQNLAPITYNVLNQTKTLSAALCCFLLFGQRQTVQQAIALGIMLVAALVMEKIIKMPCSTASNLLRNKDSQGSALSGEQQSQEAANPAIEADRTAQSRYFLSGVLPILVASFVSGLAGAWTQRSLRSSLCNNSLLFTIQLAVVSITLIVTALLIPGFSPDRERIKSEGWSVGWTAGTWIPIAVNAVGGILVGLVTKFSGAVPKGFALIAGTFLSGVLQNVYSSDTKVSSQQWAGGLLAAVSVWLHSAYPYAGNITLK